MKAESVVTDTSCHTPPTKICQHIKKMLIHVTFRDVTKAYLQFLEILTRTLKGPTWKQSRFLIFSHTDPVTSPWFVHTELSSQKRRCCTHHNVEFHLWISVNVSADCPLSHGAHYKESWLRFWPNMHRGKWQRDVFRCTFRHIITISK